MRLSKCFYLNGNTGPLKLFGVNANRKNLSHWVIGIRALERHLTLCNGLSLVLVQIGCYGLALVGPSYECNVKERSLSSLSE